MTSAEQGARRFIIVLFFLSGFSGLIYQVVWVRWLTMYVGGSAFAVGTILTVFMAGLALGSLWSARMVDRVKDTGGLVLAYGLLELGIGLYALLFPLLCMACKPLYALLYQELYGSLLAYNSLSALLSIALLIVPTALMGATLPFLCRYWVVTPSRTGTRTGWLYGVNTIGAALGALVCGFWMIRWLGVYSTVFCAAGLNLLIGAVCVLWARRIGGVRRLAFEASPAPQARSASAPGFIGIAILLASSGFCAMAYEVIWTKLISLLVGPTTYSFTVVLFSFITGLALGSLLFGWISDRVRSPFWLLFGAQLGAAVLALVTSQFLGNSQLFFAKLLFEMRGSFGQGELAKTGILFAAMLPPTLLLGAVFPIAVKICATKTESLGSSVGRLYAMNTLGALFGAFAAGFVLVPMLGQARSLMFLGGGQALVCVLVALGHARGRAVPSTVSALAGVAAILLCTRLPRWDMALLATAQYHRFDAQAESLEFISYRDALVHGPEMLRRNQVLQRTLSVEDGIDGFVGVSESVTALGQTNLVLSVSGKADASSMTDMSTEALVGHIPMLLHPRVENALVIGLASGITAGEMLHYPLSRMDVLEISPEVVRACGAFTPWNNGVLSNPRTRLIIQDARAHLTLSEERYDVIVSEPSNPWMAGIANLFTLEFFQKVRAHLKPGGVFVQWFHTYETDWEAFAVAGRSLRAVFPNTILMRTSQGYVDCQFVCFESPDGFLDLELASRNLSQATRSSNVRMHSADVLSNMVVDEDLGALFESGPVHTDAHPILEFLSPIQFYGGGGQGDIGQILAERGRLGPRTSQARASFESVGRRVEFADFLASMFRSPLGIVDTAGATPAERERYAECLQAYARLNEISYAEFESVQDPWERQVCLDAQEAAIRAQLATRAAAGDKRDLARIYFALGNVHAMRQDQAQAATWYTQALEQVPDLLPALQNLQISYERTGRYREAAQIVQRLIDLGPVTPRLLTTLAADNVKLGEEAKAFELLNRALAMDPKYAPALIVASTIFGNRNNLPRAIDYAWQAVVADPQDARGYANLAVALYKSGRQQEARNIVAQGLTAIPNDPSLTQLQLQLR